MAANFDSLSLTPELLAVVRELGFEAPTPIQAECIPALLSGGDVVGQSKTGSGKTAAFALPILQRLDLADRRIQALVICPTRELAAQVAREFRRLGRRHAGLGVLELVGGQPVRNQRDGLTRGGHVAVGTPGRLVDLLERGWLETAAITTLVLDEADRMLDMGFEAEVEQIIRQLPSARQTALFSATFPEAIAAMSRNVQSDAVHLKIVDNKARSADIREQQLTARPEDKLHALCWLLNETPHESALVFCNFKATVLELTRTLTQAGVSAARLDGDLEQTERDEALARFRNRSIRILVATDIAGRGIDVKGLDLVINYELPQQPEAYVHRIGRTGRAGKTGLAISLTGGEGDRRMRAIEELTGTRPESLAGPPEDARSVKLLLRSLSRAGRMETILISGGRKDKLRAGDILGALTGEAGSLKGTEVGTIEIQDRKTFVAVAQKVATRAVERLSSGRIKGKRFKARLLDGSPRRGSP